MYSPFSILKSSTSIYTTSSKRGTLFIRPLNPQPGPLAGALHHALLVEEPLGLDLLSLLCNSPTRCKKQVLLLHTQVLDRLVHNGAELLRHIAEHVLLEEG